MTDRRQCVSQS